MIAPNRNGFRDGLIGLVLVVVAIAIGSWLASEVAAIPRDPPAVDPNVYEDDEDAMYRAPR